MIRKLFSNSDGNEGEPEEQEDSSEPEGPTTLTGEPYDIEETSYEREGGVRTKSFTEEEGVVAGPEVREMLERGVDDPEHPLWVGYDNDAQEGFREGGIPFDSLFVHLWIAGVTGAGKTTEMLNWMIQHAYSGHGFVYFDPKGKDSRELIRKLPEDRLDDIVFIEPGTERDREIGLNLLDTPDTDSDVELETAIENRLSNLKASLEAKGELHATMESVTESMGRAMMKSNADPDAPNYGVIDFYFILLNDQRREDFYEECKDPYIKEFLGEIAEMEADDLRPLLKRVKAWVENGVIRRIIARRESSIEWEEIVKNDRIVIVRTPVESKDIKRLTTLSVMRGIWSAIQTRSYETSGDPEPFFVFADEFDDIASKQLDIQSMLARARSMRLGVCVACQYPSQLEQDVLKPLKNNADNLVTFTANDPDDARILMDRFRKYDGDDLIDTDAYNVWTQLPNDSGMGKSGGLKLNTFAPYPPLRPESEVDPIINRSLEIHGDEPLTDAQIQRELPYGHMEEMHDDGIETDAEPEEVELTDDIKRRALKHVYDFAIRLSEEANPNVKKIAIPEQLLEEAYKDEFNFSKTQGSNLLEQLVFTGQLTDGFCSTGAYYKITGEGLETLLIDTGSAGSGGSGKHRHMLSRVYVAGTKLGWDMDLPEQDGNHLPDAISYLPNEVQTAYDEATTKRGYEEGTEILKENYPLHYEVGDGGPIAFEAESTTLSKGGQTSANLTGALEENQRCVFVVMAEDDNFTANAEKCVNILTDPAFTSARGRKTVDCRFYNLGEYTFEDPQTGRDAHPIHPDPEVTLRWTDIDGTIRLEDSDRNVHAEFETREDFQNPTREDFPAVAAQNDEGDWVVIVEEDASDYRQYEKKGELRKDNTVVYKPYIPDLELPIEREEYIGATSWEEAPITDEWDVWVVPTTRRKDIAVYDPSDGTTTPLPEVHPDIELTSPGIGYDIDFDLSEFDPKTEPEEPPEDRQMEETEAHKETPEPTQQPDSKYTDKSPTGEAKNADEVPIADSNSRSNSEVVKESNDQWTKPEEGDDDYNAAKDNSNFRTGYNEEHTDADFTGGQARRMDEESEMDNYEIPETGDADETRDTSSDGEDELNQYIDDDDEENEDGENEDTLSDDLDNLL